MSTKENLIKKIEAIDNPGVLDEIDRWVTSIVYVASGETFSEEELNAVREGFTQYKSGDIFTREEANNVFDGWLNV